MDIEGRKDGQDSRKHGRETKGETEKGRRHTAGKGEKGEDGEQARQRQATRLAGQALENRSFALGAENLTELTLLPNQTFRQL